MCGCAVAFEMEYGAATAVRRDGAVAVPGAVEGAQLALLTVDFDRPPHQLATFGEPHPAGAPAAQGQGRARRRAHQAARAAAPPRAILK